MFEKNTHLVHLDFSFCGLNEKECSEIYKGLQKNHTVLGLHMAGNAIDVDANGFLTIKQDNQLVSNYFLTRLDRKKLFDFTFSTFGDWVSFKEKT